MFGAPHCGQYFACPEIDTTGTGEPACTGAAGACMLKYAFANKTQATVCTKLPTVRRASRVLSDNET
jgi:hypothetical protein